MYIRVVLDAFGTNGNLYVFACSDNQIRNFDVTTGNQLSTFSVFGLDHLAGIEFGPDGNLNVANQECVGIWQ